ncbi:putative transposase, Ptta/En/Spm, plant [Senna tora]|uniref:Putative transposase, Ptta/En/Spm, plant n=1 Tax=Senna tora TaxID=362788 RepID=A0A834WUW9_9FABA|nr:putative transposase, Ptta/En/Spm, plant [Senna tora]
MRPDQSWILRRKEPYGHVSEEFMDGVDEFLKLVNEFPINKDSLGRILCPCGRCKNCVRKDEYTIERHLYYNGFVEGYLNWTIYGENAWGGEGSAFNDVDVEDTRNPYVDMVVDVVRGRLDPNFECMEEAPNPSVSKMPFAAEHWRDYSVEDKYRFQSDNDRKMARGVWEKTCSDRYSDILTKHRKKSEAAKRSRATAPDAMLHTGGSISFGAHKKKMEAEQNQKVSWRDVYHKTHKKKNGKFVSERSKHFVENLDIALLDKYGGESSSYPEVDANLWLDVAPHSKKGRIHGLGQGLQLSRGSPNLTSSVCSTTSTTAPIIPQSQIDEAVNQAPTRSSQGEERQSTPANDDNDDADADLGV